MDRFLANPHYGEWLLDEVKAVGNSGGYIPDKNLPDRVGKLLGQESRKCLSHKQLGSPKDLDTLNLENNYLFK